MQNQERGKCWKVHKAKAELRLKLVLNDSFVFHQPHGSTKPEVFYSSFISLLDVFDSGRIIMNTSTSVATQDAWCQMMMQQLSQPR